jgi:hypothetical protein
MMICSTCSPIFKLKKKKKIKKKKKKEKKSVSTKFQLYILSQSMLIGRVHHGGRGGISTSSVASSTLIFLPL